MKKNYFINYDKSRDACSIIWQNKDYNINDLEPYISSIQCDDGEEFYNLINAEWPDSEGRDDFKVLELNNFAAVKGDVDNEYLLCYTALISTDLEKMSDFKNALNKSNNQIVARISFKKNGKPIVDVDGYEEFLFEMNTDNFVYFEKE